MSKELIEWNEYPEWVEYNAYDGEAVVTGTKQITRNGTHDVKDYAEAEVNVPNPSTGSLSITTNGTYDVKNFSSANVNVEATAEMGEITVTNNAGLTVTVESYIGESDSNGKSVMPRVGVPNGTSATAHVPFYKAGSLYYLKGILYFYSSTGMANKKFSVTSSTEYVKITELSAGIISTNGAYGYFLITCSEGSIRSADITLSSDTNIK